jgi:DNA-binding PadR family transcriptional regulator
MEYRMENELLILGLLRNQAMHGYQLMDSIHQVMSVCADLKRPTSYFILGKMKEKSWVTSTTVKDGKRPERKVYQITEAGENAYQAILRESLRTPLKMDSRGDIVFGFIQDLPNEESITLLGERKQLLENDLAEVRSIPAHFGGPKWVIEHREQTIEREIQWINQIIGRLSNPQE